MPAATTIIVIRHGESEHHLRQLTGGWTDTPLTERGHGQARLLAARLKDELGDRPVAIYSSDLQRAIQTAEHVAAALGAPLRPEPRLREWNNGDAANMTLAEARERFPAAFGGAWGVDDRPLPGGETGRELYERVAAFMEELEDDGQTAVVVAHGGSIECMIARWLLLTPDMLESIRFNMHPTGVTTLVRDRFDQPAIERLNDLAHLRDSESWIGLEQALPRRP
jgi:broad specificity phosphatase PhoE